MRLGWRLALRLHGLGVIASLLLAGCGGDDDSPDDDGGTTESTVDASTTQPPSGEESAVWPVIEDQLESWDAAITPILGDPAPVASDPQHELRADLAELFTSDSPYVRDLGLLLEGYISQDTGIRPGSAGLVQETTLLDFTATPDPDHLSFVFCSFSDGVEYNLSDGRERTPRVGVRQGAGEAIRVDGRWLLHRLQRLGVETEAADTPNPCPALAEPPGGGG